MAVAEAAVPPWSIGSVLSTMFFGSLFVFWNRMGFKTLRTWFNTTTAIVAMALLGGAFCFLLYVMWLGKQS